MTKKKEVLKTGPLKVAIYTRVSTEEQAAKEYSSLDAQREACAHYIQSRAAEGWTALDAEYNDGGYTGGNMERPALKRLLADVEAGKIDICCVYKLDRLSRKQFDLLKMIQQFEERGVGFVSITQAFDTKNPMGKFMLQTLGAFAELEREQIRERTRDKMRASRKRGLWTGGWSPLGFDNIAGKLVINSAEAAQVRAIFDTYLAEGSITATLAVLRARNWHSKEFVNREGKLIPGKPFTKFTLRTILTNPVYIGKIRFGEELAIGQHQAIIDNVTFQAVQELLKARHRGPTGNAKKSWNAMLSGLIRCAKCDRAYGHASVKSHGRVHHYYVCQSLQKRGAGACRGSRVSMRDLDSFVFSKVCGREALGGMTREQLDALESADKQRLLQLLVEEVRVDAAAGDITVTFRDDEVRRESA